MNEEEKKEVNLDFFTHTFSPPSVILAEIIAVFLVLYDYSVKGITPIALWGWLVLIGKIALVFICVLGAVFMLMIAGFIIAGGIKVNVKYIGVSIELIVFLGILFYGYTILL